MATIRRATQAEKDAYFKTSPHPVYPLYGWVKMQGHRIPVEYLGEGQDNPNYEALAPTGFIFDADGVHTLLGFTLADMRERLSMNTLEKCFCSDDCNEVHKNLKKAVS